MADIKKNTMIAQAESAVDILSDLDSKINALERGLHDYQEGLASWTSGVLTKVDDRVDDAGQLLAARERELTEKAAALETAVAEWNARQAELAERQIACETHERELKELGELLAQAQRDAAAHEQAAVAALEDREAKQHEREQTLARELAGIEELKGAVAHQSSDLDSRCRELEASIRRFEDECAARRAEVDAACAEAERRRAIAEQQSHEISAAREALHQAQQQLAEREEALQQRGAQCDELSKAAERERQRLDSDRAQVAQLIRQLEAKGSELDAREKDLTARERDLSDAEAAGHARESEIQSRFEALQRDRAELEEQGEKLRAQSVEHQNSCDAIAQREKELEHNVRKVAERLCELERREAAAEAEKQKVESLVADHRRQELALAARITGLDDRTASLDKQEARLRGSEAALKTERVELNAARESFEAEIAARRMEQQRLEEELAEHRAKLERDGAAHEAAVHALHRRNEELDRRTAALSDREADLAAQQAKLECALDNIKNDRLAVQKARAVADEVVQSRSDELGRLRTEADSLRNELAAIRENTERLERELREARDAAEHEANSARQAKCELRSFAAQSESAKAAAIESLEAERQRELSETRVALEGLRAKLDHLQQEKRRLESDLFNALESRESTTRSLQEAQAQSQQLARAIEQERAQLAARLNEVEKREQDALALVTETGRNGAPSSASPPSPANDAALLIREINGSRAGVAAFWAAFATTGSNAEGIGRIATPGSEASETPISAPTVGPTTNDPSLPPAPDASVPEEAPIEDLAAAMKAALAAAQAEVSSAGGKKSSTASSSPTKTRETAKHGGAAKPIPKPSAAVARQPQAKPVIDAPKAEIPTSSPPHADLDPATRNKLKTLKRLNPTKSEQELLAMIASETERPNKGDAKHKRGWFSRR